MTKIKIGFLGAGYIAAVHAAILARDDRADESVRTVSNVIQREIN